MRTYTLFFLGAVYACISYQFSKAQTFQEVSAASGIEHVFDVGDYTFGGGVAVFDYDNDGDEDFYITGGLEPDVLYRNNGDGTFEDVTFDAGIEATAAYITQGAFAADIDNDGDRDLFITTRCYASDTSTFSPNILYENKGSGVFTDISYDSGIDALAAFSLDACFGDFNLDGYLDLYVGNFFLGNMDDFADSVGVYQEDHVLFLGERNFLYLNNGDRTFTEMATNLGVADVGTAWSVAFSDYDKDYDPDLFVSNDFGYAIEPNALYQNNYPDVEFTDVSAASQTNVAINSMGIAVGDVNEDGWLDYYITDMADNVLHLSQGDGTFVDAAFDAGVDNTFCEVNNNGLVERFCFIYTPDTDYTGLDFLMIEACEDGNDCDTLTYVFYIESITTPPESTNDTSYVAIAINESFSVCHDLFLAHGALLQTPLHGIAETEYKEMDITVGWGANFLDYDNDTYLDLFVSNGSLTGYPFPSSQDNPNFLYRNNGDATFEDVSEMAGVDHVTKSRGSAMFDYDDDGDLDLLVAVQKNRPDWPTSEPNPHSLLYQNTASNDNNWFKVKAIGTYNNRDAIGARVEVTFDGRTLIREIEGGTSSLSHNSLIAHFGLGSYDMIDQLSVVWPGGYRQSFYNLSANQTFEVVEDAPVGMGTTSMQSSVKLYPNPSNGNKLTLIVDANQKVPENLNIKLLDVTGKVVQMWDALKANGQLIDLSLGKDLPFGIYHLHLQGKGFNETQKLILTN